MRLVKSLLIGLALYLIMMPVGIHAQFWPSLGGRIVSRDGQWLSPIANGLLSSDEDDHLRRGSVYAWDVSAPYGAFVFPMAAGTVSYAGCNNAGGYGCWTLIDHGNGYLSLYGHMIDEGGGTVRVKSGERVQVWTPMGRVGWTGMTSFGPHVHWEIHHTDRGRVRNDSYFTRSAIAYCKFCAADGTLVQQVGIGGYYANGILSREVISALLLLVVGLTLFFRPEWTAAGVQRVGVLFYRVMAHSQSVWQPYGQGRRRASVVGILFAFLLPAFLCSSGTAIAVWMADEEIDPRIVWSYLRFGLYPFPGQGYQVGAQYSAVWGIPCHGVGTLGRACEAEEIVQAAVSWQTDVAHYSKMNPIPVAIPRLEGQFTLDAARKLLNEMHYVDGLAIIDVGSDFALAHKVVDELTAYGLDGIAIDMEFLETVQRNDIYWLAERMAQRRRLANLPGKGVLVLWNVFDNIDNGNIAGAADVLAPPPTALATTNSATQITELITESVDQLQDNSDGAVTIADTSFFVDTIAIVPIFTGFGSAETKIAGLKRTQKLFQVDAEASGLMAFDQRWPINRRCQTFNTTLGFDCQDWRSLFAQPTAARAGWWVQQ